MKELKIKTKDHIGTDVLEAFDDPDAGLVIQIGFMERDSWRAIILSDAQAKRLRDWLTAWLDEEEKKSPMTKGPKP